jgi:hypothetical protein
MLEAILAACVVAALYLLAFTPSNMPEWAPGVALGLLFVTLLVLVHMASRPEHDDQLEPDEHRDNAVG